MINTWPGWESVKLLGKGSYGAVYEIQKEEFGKVYNAALKVISIPLDEEEYKTVASMGLDEQSITDYFYSSVKNVVKECALMHDLKGITNIVSYEDHMVVEREDSFGWDILIRMELLTPLEEYIRSARLTKKDIIKIGIDICSALEVCEKRYILHRDIKPANIFVSKYGDFKLGDFGIARTMEKAKGNLSTKGTFNYMAPEVYKGEVYDQTVDQYSLGIVLYRLLNNNRLPFLPDGNITLNDMNKAQEMRMKGESIPLPKYAKDELGNIILKAIQYNPMDRYPSASSFKQALEQYLNPIPVVKEEPKPEYNSYEDEKTVNVNKEEVKPYSGPIKQNVEAEGPPNVPPRPIENPNPVQQGIQSTSSVHTNSRPKWLYGVIAALVIVVAIIGGVFAFGGSSRGVKITGINSEAENDSKKKKSNFTQEDPLYIHFEMKGLKKDETVSLTFDVEYPNGESEHLDDFMTDLGNGEPNWIGWENGVGNAGYGKLKVTFILEDKEIETITVKIVE